MLKTKKVEIEGISFKIKQFTPARGFAVLRELLTQSFPAEFLESLGLHDVLGKFIGKPKNQDLLTAVKNFEEVQKLLLSEVTFLSGDVYVNVLDIAGNPRLPDEVDLYMVFGRLYIEVIKVSYYDFFIKCQAEVLKFMEQSNLLTPEGEKPESGVQGAMQEFATKYLQSEKN